ncbi:uncharacterized protein [Procambarus clarkii]|uniref:uncharacterized protein isoform X1 n=1 Tax=Procambarus clarkii TaxID=6728 RepID=UPI003742A881
MFQRSTLANFIKRRRREKETIRRFETVEKEVRTSNPARAEDLIRLRDEHLTYHTTWCRIKYHPRLLKVNKSEEELQEVDETNEEIEQLLQSESRRSHHGYGPRLNMIWERRLEDSERERLERAKELEVAREAFRKEMEKSLKSTPSAVSRLYQTPRGRTFGPAPSRPQRRRPSMPDKTLALGCSLDNFSVGTSRLSNFSSAFRRDAQPPPYSALQRAGKIVVQEYAKSGAKVSTKVVTKVKPFTFEASGRKRHSCTVHHHFHH